MIAGMGAFPAPAPAPVVSATYNCSVLPGVLPVDMQGTLSYLCGQGHVDCAAIQCPGGARCKPNTVTAHLDYAMDGYFRAHAATGGFGACYFQGEASLAPSPRGYSVWPATGSVLSAAVLPPKAAVGKVSVIPPNSNTTFSTGKLSWSGAKATSLSTRFNVWAAKNISTSELCSMYAVVSYDFDGDDKVDRQENYNKYFLGTAPLYEAYTEKVAASQTKGAWQAMKNGGSISVTLVNEMSPNCGVMVLAATKDSPSSISAPFYELP